MEKNYKRYQLGSQDILFQSRGASRLATVVPQELDPVIAAAPIMIITPDLKKVNPIYLAWFLNSAAGQHQMDRLAVGTDIQMLRRSELETIKIELPSLTVQD